MFRYLFLFLHVSSAMGVFAALGIEAGALFQLRGAAGPADVRTVLRAYQLVRVVGALSLVGLLVTGIYLATAVWGWRGPWIGLGFLGLVLTAAVGGVATRSGVARLERGAGGAGGATPASYRRNPVLHASLLARVAILVGVVYLMTVKPAVRAALVATAVALVAAAVAAVAVLRGGAGAGNAPPAAP
jgi:hypothetical protein